MGNETIQDTSFFNEKREKQVFGEISGNAENGNGNEVFSNVTKRRFESKNDVSSHPYEGLLYIRLQRYNQMRPPVKQCL
jgi:hypothetical protein